MPSSRSISSKTSPNCAASASVRARASPRWPVKKFHAQEPPAVPPPAPCGAAPAGAPSSLSASAKGSAYEAPAPPNSRRWASYSRRRAASDSV